MAGDRYADGSREIMYFTQSMQLLTGGVGTVSDVLYKTLNLMKDDPVNKALADALKHDDAVMYETDNFKEASELRKKLGENGIEFTAVAAYKDKVYVVVPKGDMERAGEIVNDFYDSRSSGVYTADYINYYSNGNVREVKGLSEEEAILFVERCKGAHVPVNVEGPSDGKFRLRFAEKDLDKMNRIRIDTAVSMHGPAGNLYREQLKWRNDYGKAVLNSVITGKFPDGRTVPEGSAIIDRSGKRIEVTKQYIKVFESGSSKSFSRNADAALMRKNMEEVSRFAKGMESPVFLSGKEYSMQKNMDTFDRQAFFSEKERAGFLLPREIYQSDLVKNFEKGRAPDGSRLHNGDIIVDDKGNRIEVKMDQYVITRKGGAPETIRKNADDKQTQVIEHIKSMHNPVYLSAAKAKELTEAENPVEMIRMEEAGTREYVPGRPVISQEDITLLAKAEAMRHTVDVRLKHDGIELPKTEQMTYHDAAQIFGLSEAEQGELNQALQQGFSAEAEEDIVSDVVDQVEVHFGKTEPQETVIPISGEIEAEALFDDREMDADFSFADDFAQAELDLEDF